MKASKYWITMSDGSRKSCPYACFTIKLCNDCYRKYNFKYITQDDRNTCFFSEYTTSIGAA